jgi:type II secretory pathway pseudopilin PulG
MTTFCPACGNGMTAEDKFCRSCGAPTSAVAATASVLPPVPAGPVETSGKAITSLVCGLMFFIPFAFVAAIVFGHLALSEIKKSAGRLKGDGLAIAGLVLGYMWVVSIPVVIIIAAIAIPNLLRARMAANESSAIAAIRAIQTAEMSYSGSHSGSGYACSLSDLGGDQLIDSGLASGQKNGYLFEISGCAPGTDGAANQMYQVMVRPITPNTTGVRSFCSDESAVIRIDPGGTGTCAERGRPL